MRLLFCSDFHYQIQYPIAEKGYKSVFNKVTGIEERIRQVLSREDVDLILIGGDLTEDGSVEDYQSLKSIMDEVCHKPVLFTLGNHDIRENFYGGFFGIQASDSYNNVLDLDGYRFISFDNSDPRHNGGYITEIQKQWLIKQLKEAEDKEVILMMHHHILHEQHEMPPIPMDKELFEQITHKPVKLILTGHTHYSYQTQINDVPLINAGGLNFQAYWDEDELVFTNKASYTVIDLNGIITSEVVQLEEPIKELARLKTL